MAACANLAMKRPWPVVYVQSLIVYIFQGSSLLPPGTQRSSLGFSLTKLASLFPPSVESPAKANDPESLVGLPRSLRQTCSRVSGDYFFALSGALVWRSESVRPGLSLR